MSRPAANRPTVGVRIVRVSTGAVVALLAVVAAIVSYRHILTVVTAHGESGLTAYLVPLCIDGLLVAASLTLLDSARRGLARHWLSWVALGVGIALTLGANVLYGWRYGIVGAITAALPAVTLTIAFELLMGLIHRSAALTRTDAVRTGGSTSVRPVRLTRAIPVRPVRRAALPDTARPVERVPAIAGAKPVRAGAGAADAVRESPVQPDLDGAAPVRDRESVVAELAAEIAAARARGAGWTPDYPVLMERTGYGRSWCEKAVRQARDLTRETGVEPEPGVSWCTLPETPGLEIPVFDEVMS
ncbi:DUF2637 domain-containing protein [Rhizohabitans arisaemae]|uniref:DUF2637 domain-containing protein n=1 Tax=Rhizohabitans arisaemae TaxID=2720610 RepID=UPI0024B046F4|nr:DUF2637 domain-containing protein [Rhizohabitans arisaemae]